MSKGDRVEGLYYGRRSDGVDLYRFAVPNVRSNPKPIGEPIAINEEDYWEKPKFKVLQVETDLTYCCAIDVDGKGYSYEETDIEIHYPEPDKDDDKSTN